MDTVRVKIAYRPLRICWAIKQGDFAAFREVVRTNHALWGGRRIDSSELLAVLTCCLT